LTSGPPRAERLAAGAARLSDRLLDFLVLGVGAWTGCYHACLLLDAGTAAALIAWGISLVPCAWVAFRQRDADPAETPPPLEVEWPRRRLALVLGGYALAAVGAAAVYAFADARWTFVWLVLFLAAATGAGLAFLRTTGLVRLELADDGARAWPGALVALAWAGALAVLSLFLVRPDADDTQYVHLSTWIAEHGEFPLRDTLFSDQVFPAVIYPPLSSFEALIGAVAGAVGASAPDATYFFVPPLATALGVLALWRLLRTWRAPMVGLALSTTTVFLLMAAQEHRTLGNLFVGRIWQGKIVFLVVLVPLLFVLLQAYAERPTWRQGVLLVAAGAAGVGLTTTGTFLVPALGAGCLIPLALRSVRQAALGFAAVSAYPLGALAVTALVGARRAGEDFESDVVTGEIARIVLGSGLFAFVAVAAALVGPVLIAGRRAALMVASTVLLVAVFYAPPVPPLVWEVADIGRVLWRVVWIVPVAALVGIVVTAIPARAGPLVRGAPAVLLCAALIVWGRPVWDSGTVESSPSWKRPPESVTAARRILERSEPGDVVLAPQEIAQTVLITSGDVTTVSPRVFYTLALEDEPEAYVEERVLLQSLLEPELVAALTTVPEGADDGREIARALRLVGVDVACIQTRRNGALRAVEAAGYSPSFSVSGLTCLERG
jgi:hypothetical protein